MANLDALLDRLYAVSIGQEPELGDYFAEHAVSGGSGWGRLDAGTNRFLADKMVALDRDKAQFCAKLCIALRAKRVVEAGTSYAVSTLQLAHAVQLVAAADQTPGIVIATEYEPEKAAAARQNLQAAGLAELVDLREGDLRETLTVIEGPVDFALIDIWTEMARPALELITPHLRPGAVVVTDNTTSHAEDYADYFDFIRDPANEFLTQTLPFSGGLELTVKL
ncbi:class I SAM-dependent methyltransferase [Mycobacterium sp.]|uniref:O-methyltransferase n=1 Tax=Mycobacterium sp. TaxID=1785 RepID=UPI0031E3F5E2